jgi:hypothetical protein
MEMLTLVLSTYIDWLTSWWWISLAVVTFIFSIACVLKEDDPTLPITKAMVLSFAGTLSLIPIVQRLVSLITWVDFHTRWVMAVDLSYGRFVMSTLLILCVLFVPIIFLFDVYALSVTQYRNSNFFIRRHL